MTSDEHNAAADELFAQVADIIKTYKADDMVAEKILDRVAIVGAMGGTTRTTALGAAAFAGIYCCLTGLTKSQVLGLVGDLFDVVEANPATAEAKQAYTEANAQFKAKAATQSTVAAEHGFKDVGDMILSPMPKLKQ